MPPAHIPLGILDKDGLLTTEHVRIADTGFELKSNGIPIFVAPAAQRVVDILARDADLWNVSRIKFSTENFGMKRIPIFGVPFEAAIKLLTQRHKNKHIKSLFRLLDGDQVACKGLEAELLAHVGIEEDNIKLEAWQLSRQSEETFYCHALLNADGTIFNHLDGAIITHTEEDHSRLFQDGEKVKGTGYQKYFRLDGKIEFDRAVDIVNGYFPIEQISHEYFEVKRENSEI
jgi:hypothetical protein